jgi:purine-nucleoside phosphorylase
MEYQEQISAASAYLNQLGITNVDYGVVLGTGLGKFINHINIIQSINYDDIPHMVHATVESHKGKLIYGKVGNKFVLAMQGRFHYYEGYSMQQITFPIRVMKAVGIKKLIISNAAGGLNPAFKKGALVVLNDHINLQSENPLRGLRGPSFEPRFPDMSMPYHPQLSASIKQQAQQLHIELHEGVYVAVTGPNLETRAEYRMLRLLGADMVGMSTVPEVIVANQMGLPCAAISVITDECDPDNLQPVGIAEIIAVANTADERLSKLISEVIKMD